MSQKLPVNGFQWVENTSPFHEDFIKNYNEDSVMQVIFLIFSWIFLPERMKIEKAEKLVVNLNDKKEYVIHIRNLK